jgi:pimeloyl-ACP methyl ester carboxylesterase
MAQSVYKSPESREKFRDYYGNVLGRLPFGQQYVETAFGRTFLLTAGQDSTPPVILLHGSCTNSAFWFQEMTALSGNYRVYAVDIVGEAGNSGEVRPDLRSDAFALWMKDVLDALGIDHAVFIGNSLGGWTALKFAAVFPERVSKLILIASAGIAQIRPKFLSDVAQARREDGTVPMTPSIVGEQSIPKAVLDFINLIIESYNPIEELPLYTDEQLRRLNMPVLFIDGEDDVIIDAAESAQRLTNLVPSAEIHVLPNCGHAVFNALSLIITFLEKEA